MRIATWNVNSLKVRLPAVLDWLASRRPDVIGLQELKLTDADFPRDALRAAGYEAVVAGQKTYNGVALLARAPLQDPATAVPELAWDPSARAVAATVGGIRFLNLYVPNGQEVGTEKYAYKLRWLDDLARHLDAAHRPDQPLMLLGDFNLIPEERDAYDPQEFRFSIMFTDEERARFRRLVDWGLADVFRRCDDAPKRYSWWDYRMNAFRRNLGARIDLLLATAPVAARAVAAEIDVEPRRAEKPSDHAPVFADLDGPPG
jgi:exodeoxyribonuclease-3